MRFRTRQRVPTVDSCSAGAGVEAGVNVAAATTTLVNADFTDFTLRYTAASAPSFNAYLSWVERILVRAQSRLDRHFFAPSLDSILTACTAHNPTHVQYPHAVRHNKEEEITRVWYGHYTAGVCKAEHSTSW